MRNLPAGPAAHGYRPRYYADRGYINRSRTKKVDIRNAASCFDSHADISAMGRLKGWLGFCLATEPLFVSRMRAKYGSEVLDRVLKFRVPQRPGGPAAVDQP